MSRKLFFLIVIVVSFNLNGQNKDYYGNKNDAFDLCTIQIDAASQFVSNQEAEKTLEQILNVVGISKNFVLFQCNGINNCSAITYKGVRYIFYDSNFLKEISSNTGSWSKISILAHEIGHHINGHTLELSALINGDIESKSIEVKRLEELEADEFSGFVLAKLGAKLSDAQAAIEEYSFDGDDSYSTHPTKSKRLYAIEKGYFSSNPSSNTSLLPNGLYAEFITSKGKIICFLEHEKTPMTVANFIGLVEGNLKAGQNVISKPLYDGLKFHRVIKDFMIQGGDPLGNGTGGPGYKFPDEFVTELKHSGPGILSMANSGPATNGSQFFITHKSTPWLDGKHTVFGHVIQGQEVVNSIEQNDLIKQVKILRVGTEAENFDANANFQKFYSQFLENDKENEDLHSKLRSMSQEEYKKYMYKEVKTLYPNAILSPTGLVYVIEKKGIGNKPQKGDQVTLHYTGMLRLDGKKFDSSYDRNQPMPFKYLENRMIPGFEEGIGLIGAGGKAKLIIPYYQAYGAQGRPGAIPPYSDLVFDIEILSITQ
jgi:peptidyl-prolyl cis-trans isomerase A (cyclophilin A)